MKKINAIAYICMLTLLLVSCNENKKNESRSFSNSNDFVTGNNVDLSAVALTLKGVKPEDLKNSQVDNSKAIGDSVLATLPQPASSKQDNISSLTRLDMEATKTYVQMYDGNGNAGISVPGFGSLKLGKKESNLNVYYVETKKVKVNGEDKLVGIGYSVHYLFKQIKGGLSADNIPSIAASVQIDGGKTKVYYSLQSYGIVGTELSKFFKPTFNKDFNVEGYGSMQVNVDGIHKIITGEISNTGIRFRPELLTDAVFYTK
ncbi:hypothetical protein NAL32_07400 [Chryseobacterium sp. Ch-15]|uniref:Lipoprotein n=1 Tax=Chryseobacterium muglaense TaxID=2893752 RepID=A0A9Q3YTL2_9FLAO|nr:hypothetical protein [Chryseobacterium muglaense]MBD3904456.1 hypothetical protein [Chryseobacterium muglaense]MCC9032725.1 hypothetical protein [Chryseobacterium muglaense]MCM2554218.1 hypothetical protein [Chryseobacterium muglaense]